MVTPFAGVWIEIAKYFAEKLSEIVTPFAGVWIEIGEVLRGMKEKATSLPSRECGLKLFKMFVVLHSQIRHSLRGSVD